ncbi:MAG: UDP-N-acetylmuramoyl-tripeptide--D-alanyl-D-alanine ligase [Hydrogenibacillus sp.]|nr:UDP-N-acetylmuramoyl-tripeptide--D-alanyl-D-alanine ligase [Hydrogenibacillus sp.]
MLLTLEDVRRHVALAEIGTPPEDLAAVPLSSVSIDTRTIRSGALYVPIVGARFDGHDFVREAFRKGAQAALWQQDHGPPPEDGVVFVVDDTRRTLMDLARLNRRRFGRPVIAVTGSNGKTTTKALLAQALGARYRVLASEGNQNNDIGLPLTLLRLGAAHDLAVVEMGMNHAGEIRRLAECAEPDVGVVTNIGEAHIGHLGSREAIADAKLELLCGLRSDGDFIYPAEEPLIARHPWLQAFGGRRWTVGRTEAARIRYRLLADRGFEGTLWAVRATDEGSTDEAVLHVPLFGEALGANGVLAYAVSRLFGVTADEANTAWRALPAIPGRMRVVRGIGGMTLIDDAYNAAPTSVRAAVRALASLRGYSDRIAVLGDIGELGAHAESLLETLAEERAFERITVLTVGEMIETLTRALKRRGLAARHFTDRAALIAALRVYARPDAVVLVKASRAAALETVVQALEDAAGTEGEPPTNADDAPYADDGGVR